jgi:hypothetical protein
MSSPPDSTIPPATKAADCAIANRQLTSAQRGQLAMTVWPSSLTNCDFASASRVAGQVEQLRHRLSKTSTKSNHTFQNSFRLEITSQFFEDSSAKPASSLSIKVDVAAGHLRKKLTPPWRQKARFQRGF